MRSRPHRAGPLLASLLFALARSGLASDSLPASFVLNVHGPEMSRETQEGLCRLLHFGAADGAGSRVSSQCGNYPPQTLEMFKLLYRPCALRAIVDVERLTEAGLDYRVTATNACRVHESDYERFVWTVNAKDPREAEGAVRRLVTKLARYDRSLRSIKEQFLVVASHESQLVRVTPDGKLLDRGTGSELDFDTAFARLEKETPRARNFLRAALELTGFVGVGIAGYWALSPGFVDDWDHDFSWESWRSKLLFREDGVAMDNNDLFINGITHPVAGSIYYLAARESGFSLMESYLFALAGSSIWELFGEFKEIVSINDMVMTPVGGAVMGEVFHQLASHLRATTGSLVSKVLISVFNSPAALGTWVDRKGPRALKAQPALGFDPAAFAKLSLFASTGSKTLAPSGGGGGATQVFEVGAETEIINAPRYASEGESSRFLADGELTSMLFKVGVSPEGWEEIRWMLKASMLGYYRHKGARDAAGDLNGYSFFVGLSSAYDFERYRTSGFMDRLAIVNVLGPTMDLTIFHRGARFRVVADVFGDFAAVRSFAWEKFAGVGDATAVKSILQTQQYSFNFGLTARLKAVATLSWVEVGASGAFHAWDSIESADRSQEAVTQDLGTTDILADGSFWVDFLLGKKVRLGTSFDLRFRQGSMGGQTAAETQTQVLLNLKFLF